MQRNEALPGFGGKGVKAMGKDRAAWGLGVLAAVVIGVASCGGATPGTTVTKAAYAAPPASTASSTVATPASGPAAAPSAPTPTAAVPAVAPVSPTTAARNHAGTSTTRAPSVTTVPTPTVPTAVTTSPTTATTLVPRRQPTAAQVNQVISTVHNLLPVFTPTAAQIAAAGDAVCSAFDQGKTFTQVKALVLTMVGAGSLSALIPAAIPANAVTSLVGLYCPGYAPKLV
jgi:hypothetical protein